MLTLRLRGDATVEEKSADWFVLSAPEVGQLSFRSLSPGFIAVLHALNNGGATEQALENMVLEQDGARRLIPFYQFIGNLAGQSMLSHTVVQDQRSLAGIVPIARHYRFNSRLIKADQAYLFSRFAYMRQENGAFVLETPRGYAKVTLLAEPAFTLLAALAAPRSCQDLATQLNLDEKIVYEFVNLLANAGALVAVQPGEPSEETTAVGLAMWDFHDLLFHARSRQGRHNYGYGGTSRFQGKYPPLPVVKSYPEAEVIALPRPDVAALCAADVPFTAALESRRSLRYYNENAPITLEQLGHFLYRSARIQQVLETAPDMPDFSLRPYPGGGAAHELNIYPVIGQCDGAPVGLYYYNPLDHVLHRLTGDNEYVRRLLHVGWVTATRKSQPQVYFGITARFQRLQWKYESMMYALILKNLGGLYQTFYLTATAMGLAPCALGGGNSDLFGLAAGLNYYEESLVGEFVLGSRSPENPAEW